MCRISCCWTTKLGEVSGYEQLSEAKSEVFEQAADGKCRQRE